MTVAPSPSLWHSGGLPACKPDPVAAARRAGRTHRSRPGPRGGPTRPGGGRGPGKSVEVDGGLTLVVLSLRAYPTHAIGEASRAIRSGRMHKPRSVLPSVLNGGIDEAGYRPITRQRVRRLGAGQTREPERVGSRVPLSAGQCVPCLRRVAK